MQNIVRYELETAWWLYNAFGIASDTAHVTTASNWALYNFSNPGFDRDLISEAVVQAMFESLESTAFEQAQSHRKPRIGMDKRMEVHPTDCCRRSRPDGFPRHCNPS